MASQQRYVSNELTHFVGRGLRDSERRYESLLQIVRSGLLKSPGQSDIQVEPGFKGPVTRIKHSRTVLSNKSLSSNDKYQASVVCFADIPLEDLPLHIQKYSPFGLSFRKPFLTAQGANPVFYVVRRSATHVTNLDSLNSPNSTALTEAHKTRGAVGNWWNYDRAELFDGAELALQRVFPTYDTYTGRPESSSPIPVVHPPLDESNRDLLSQFMGAYLFPYMKFFDLLPDEHPDNFYMEREWRVFGALSFVVSDIERILIPRAFSARLRTDLPEYFGQITFTD